MRLLLFLPPQRPVCWSGKRLSHWDGLWAEKLDGEGLSFRNSPFPSFKVAVLCSERCLIFPAKEIKTLSKSLLNVMCVDCEDILRTGLRPPQRAGRSRLLGGGNTLRACESTHVNTRCVYILPWGHWKLRACDGPWQCSHCVWHCRVFARLKARICEF